MRPSAVTPRTVSERRERRYRLLIATLIVDARPAARCTTRRAITRRPRRRVSVAVQRSEGVRLSTTPVRDRVGRRSVTRSAAGGAATGSTTGVVVASVAGGGGAG